MTLQMHYQEKFEQGLERGLEQGLERGLEQGLERGLEQGIRQSALRMIKAGKLSSEEIALYSGLTLEQVTELEKELQTV